MSKPGHTYQRRTLELTLSKVDLRVTGEPAGVSSEHLLVARLLWPRPAIVEKVAFKSIELADGALDLGEADWTDRILFKEQVLGPFGVEIGVTTRVRDARVSEFVRTFVSSLFSIAGSEADDLATGLPGGLVSLPFKGLARDASGSGSDDPRLIAAGARTLVAEELGSGTGEEPVAIDLVAPEPVWRIKRGRKQGQPSARRETLLKADQPNGAVGLVARLYD